MNARILHQPAKGLPLSPRHFSTFTDSPGTRGCNAMLGTQSYRNGALRGAQNTPTRSAALGSLPAVGSCSGASPEDAPLTISRTQRRSKQRRRLVDSDDEAHDGTAECGSAQPLSPKSGTCPPRSAAARSALVQPLHNVTNLQPASIPDSTHSSARRPATVPAAATSACDGKKGILELAVLLGADATNQRASAGPAADGLRCGGDLGTASSAALAGAAPAPLTQDVAVPAAGMTGCVQRTLGSASPGAAPSADGSDGEDEAPLVFTRSIRAPRTARRRKLDDGDSDSDLGDRTRSSTASLRQDCTGPAGTAAGLFASALGHGVEQSCIVDTGEDARAWQQHLENQDPTPVDRAGTSIVTEPLGGTEGPCSSSSNNNSQSSSLRSSLSFHSAYGSDGGGADSVQRQPPHPTASSCSDVEDVGQRLVGASLNGATVAGVGALADCLAGLSLNPTRSAAIGDSGAVTSTIQISCEAPITSSSASVQPSAPLTAVSQLALVPRRRQGQRDGRDVLGEAAASALAGAASVPSCGSAAATLGLFPGPAPMGDSGGGGNGDSRTAAADDADGLSFDLYGELQLLTQLRGLSLAAGGPPDEDGVGQSGSSNSAADDERVDVGVRRADSPSCRSPSPPRAAGPPASEVLDLTSLTSSGRRSSAQTRETPDFGTPAEPEVGDGDANDVQDGGASFRASPAGLIEVYRQAQPGSLQAAEAAVASLPSGGIASGSTAAHGHETPCASTSSGSRRAAAPAGQEQGAAEPESPDSDMDIVARPRWQQRPPPTTARRRVVLLLDSSPEASSPQQEPRPPVPVPEERAPVSHKRGSAGPLTWGQGGEALTTPAPSYDPYEILNDDDDDTLSSPTSDGGAEDDQERDCALQTPLPVFGRGGGGARATGGGRLDLGNLLATPSLPQTLLTPATVLGGGGLPTGPGRKGQRRRGGLAADGDVAPAGQEVAPATGGTATGKKTRGKTPGAGAAAAQRAFLASRAKVAKELYDKWNEAVFGGQLPPTLPLLWNSRLTSTAGQVVAERELKGSTRRVAAKLELSPRLIDCLEKLRNTLAHEMCHVAAWHLSHEYDRPHGPAWEHWARRFTAHDSSLVIRRTHDYIVHYAHRWRCTREGCGKEYGRQRQTIRVGVHVCAVCHAQLEYLGHFDKNGNLRTRRAAAVGPGGDAGAGAAGTAAKPLTEFARFCKENFQSVRTSMPARTPASAVFKHMGLLYQKQKATLAATLAAGGRTSPAARPADRGSPPQGANSGKPSPREGALRGQGGGSATRRQSASPSGLGLVSGGSSEDRGRGRRGRCDVDLGPLFMDMSLADDDNHGVDDDDKHGAVDDQ